MLVGFCVVRSLCVGVVLFVDLCPLLCVALGVFFASVFCSCGRHSAALNDDRFHHTCKLPFLRVSLTSYRGTFEPVECL